MSAALKVFWALLLACAAGTPAFAQPRAVVSATFLTQPSSDSFNVKTTSNSNRENATFNGDFDVSSGYGFDAHVMVRTWGRFALGGGVSRVSRPASGSLQGSYPHPFFFSKPRIASANFSGNDRSEQAVHLNAGFLVPTRPRVTVLIFGGVSFFSVDQPVATSLNITESYPYDAIASAAPAVTSISSRFTGFNAGADLAWFFGKNVGVGGTVRIVKGSDGSSTQSRPFTVDAGGVQGGIGVRFRF